MTNSKVPASISPGGSEQDSEQPQQGPDTLSARLTNFLFAAFQSKTKGASTGCDETVELIPCSE